jgi:hypothetical protein
MGRGKMRVFRKGGEEVDEDREGRRMMKIG